ncbi:cell division cycle protein 20 homolog B [Protopterus annectens]|uniref:cell division cycle protein 20 homolog B n=1 Tax=Protopterus annectens TaxID=7888 RepID=UPI001CFA3587|nr:cell division cycle protein 20 homolog B [Protopterus annectens]
MLSELECDTGKTPYSKFKSYIVKKIRSQMHVVSSPITTRWQQDQTNDGSFVAQLPLDLSSESSEDSQPTIQKLSNVVTAQGMELIVQPHYVTGAGMELIVQPHYVTGTKIELIVQQHYVTGTGMELIVQPHYVTGAGMELIVQPHYVTGAGMELIVQPHYVTGAGMELIVQSHYVTGTGMELIVQPHYVTGTGMELNNGQSGLRLDGVALLELTNIAKSKHINDSHSYSYHFDKDFLTISDYVVDQRECQKTSFKPYISSDNISCGIHLQLEKKIHIHGLKDDYYLNILDWNYQNLLAIGLGSTAAVWNANSHMLAASIDMNSDSKFVSAVAWIKDRNCLSIGTRDGEIQLKKIWDIEYKKRLRNMLGHMSIIGALSWNNYILSSGSMLGHIHHHDVRIAKHQVGTINQKSSICALKWSSDGRCIAAGSSNGLLNLWLNDPGLTMHCKPLCTMAHPTAVKAMNWCPWQTNILVTGGGMRDGHLRIWDTSTGECTRSANTNSQVCSLEWMPETKCILTGHGLAINQLSIWKYPSLMRATDVYGKNFQIMCIIKAMKVKRRPLAGVVK